MIGLGLSDDSSIILFFNTETALEKKEEEGDENKVFGTFWCVQFFLDSLGVKNDGLKEEKKHAVVSRRFWRRTKIMASVSKW